MTEEVKTKGELIAERLEKEADEMMKQIQVSLVPAPHFRRPIPCVQILAWCT